MIIFTTFRKRIKTFNNLIYSDDIVNKIFSIKYSFIPYCIIPTFLACLWSVLWTVLYCSEKVLYTTTSGIETAIICTLLMISLAAIRLYISLNMYFRLLKSCREFFSSCITLGRLLMFSTQSKDYPGFAATTDRHSCIDLIVSLGIATKNNMLEDYGIKQRELNLLVDKMPTLKNMYNCFESFFDPQVSLSSSIQSTKNDKQNENDCRETMNDLTESLSYGVSIKFENKSQLVTIRERKVDYSDVVPYMKEVTNFVRPFSNLPQVILTYLCHSILTLRQRGSVIVDAEYSNVLELLKKLEECLSSFDKNESSSTYHFISTHFIQVLTLYLLFLPFMIVSNYRWGTIPINIGITFVFSSLHCISLQLENPFLSTFKAINIDFHCAKMVARLRELLNFVCEANSEGKPHIKWENPNPNIDNWKSNTFSNQDSYNNNNYDYNENQPRNYDATLDLNYQLNNKNTDKKYNDTTDDMDPYYLLSKDDTLFPNQEQEWLSPNFSSKSSNLNNVRNNISLNKKKSGEDKKEYYYKHKGKINKSLKLNYHEDQIGNADTLLINDSNSLNDNLSPSIDNNFPDIILETNHTDKSFSFNKAPNLNNKLNSPKYSIRKQDFNEDSSSSSSISLKSPVYKTNSINSQVIGTGFITEETTNTKSLLASSNSTTKMYYENASSTINNTSTTNSTSHTSSATLTSSTSIGKNFVNNSIINNKHRKDTIISPNHGANIISNKSYSTKSKNDQLIIDMDSKNDGVYSKSNIESMTYSVDRLSNYNSGYDSHSVAIDMSSNSQFNSKKSLRNPPLMHDYHFHYNDNINKDKNFTNIKANKQSIFQLALNGTSSWRTQN